MAGYRVHVFSKIQNQFETIEWILNQKCVLVQIVTN